MSEFVHRQPEPCTNVLVETVQSTSTVSRITARNLADTEADFREYLLSYAAAFGVEKFYRLGTSVSAVIKTPDDSKSCKDFYARIERAYCRAPDYKGANTSPARR